MARKRGRPSLRPIWAEKIKPFVPTTTDINPKHIAEIAQQAGLYYDQARRGWEYLKSQNLPIFMISSHRGIQFSNDPVLARKENAWTASYVNTRLQRFYSGTLRPYLDSLPESQARLARRSFTRALEDVGDLIEANVA